ncbi:hypothetical protein AGR1B_Cc120172 [Agrobacterium fabacearum S56]|nr:hypothetical protein AGR1B_Cc120172 [Agrobacterium fabacearum S56]
MHANDRRHPFSEGFVSGLRHERLHVPEPT